MNKYTIHIIDDESQIISLLKIGLESLDYQVISSQNLKDGITNAAIYPPDLIFLDINQPDGSGQDGLIKLREWYNGPIIMLTVLGDEKNLVQAFENGANDYLSKPFRMGELLARTKNLLKNINHNNETSFSSGDFSIDYIGRVVRKNNQVIKLTVTEYNLLAILTKNHGRIVTHAHLLREVWGPSFAKESNYLRVFFAQLRKKLEDDPTKPVHIITEARIGYRFM